MSGAMNLISGNVAGCVPTEGRYLPFSGVSAATVNLSTCSSHAHYKTFSKFMISLNRPSKSRSYICSATPGSYRRNPDFSKQNKQGFSRRTNRQNEERDDNIDNHLEDSESFASKNGPLSVSNNNQRFQGTATPGPREKEIVELFRKVQAKLRQRAGSKEDNNYNKKVEDPLLESKQGETVDSLLNLLRKHSVSKGKRNNSGSSSNNRDFGFDQPERKYSAPFESNNVVKQDVKESHTPFNVVKPDVKESQTSFSARPTSNFQKRSPITRGKYRPTYSDEEIVNINGKRKESFELEPEPEPELKPEPETIFADGGVFDDMIVEYENSEDDHDDDDDDDHDDDEDHDDDDDDDDDEEDVDVIEERDLSGLKVAELRALAKSRGMKGFSKLKKGDLLELLSGGSD